MVLRIVMARTSRLFSFIFYYKEVSIYNQILKQIMEVFGEYLVKYKKDAEAKPEGESSEVPSCYTRIPLEESLLASDAPYIALLFTAEYAPPCAPFLASFTAFTNEANKDPTKKKFDVVVVNCDRTEEEYRTNIAKMPANWYCVPYEAIKVIEKLEDIAQASTIPRVSILSRLRPEEPLLKDIKPIILKPSADAAVKELMDKLSHL